MCRAGLSYWHGYWFRWSQHRDSYPSHRPVRLVRLPGVGMMSGPLFRDGGGADDVRGFAASRLRAGRSCPGRWRAPYHEADARRRPTEEPWAPAGYDPPQRTDQWTPPGPAQTPWGAARPGDGFGGPRESHGPINGHRPGAHDESLPVPYTPAPAPIPQAPEADPVAAAADPRPGCVVRRVPARRAAGRQRRPLRRDRLRPLRIPAERAAAAVIERRRRRRRPGLDPAADRPAFLRRAQLRRTVLTAVHRYRARAAVERPPGGGSNDDSGGFGGFAPAGSGFGGAQAALPQGATPTSGAPHSGSAHGGSAHSGSAQVGSARVAGSMGAASVPMGAVRIDPGQFAAAEQPNRFGEADDERGGHASVPSQGRPTSGPPSGSAPTGRAVSASASVPTASRVQPTTDQPLPPPACRAATAAGLRARCRPPAEPSPSGFAPGGDQAAGEGFGVGRGSAGFQVRAVPGQRQLPRLRRCAQLRRPAGWSRRRGLRWPAAWLPGLTGPFRRGWLRRSAARLPRFAGPLRPRFAVPR